MFWAKKIKPTPLAVPVPRTFSTSRKKIPAKVGGGQYDPLPGIQCFDPYALTSNKQKSIQKHVLGGL